MNHAESKPQRGKRGIAAHGRASRQQSIRLPYARVLVVDDHIANLVMAKRMMQPYGIHVDCVTNGRLAVEAIRAGHVRYSAVFMDYLMPGMDGMEAVRIIREEIGSQYARTVPIIAFTASIVAEDEAGFLHSGFQAILTKPLEAAPLDAVIRAWVWDEKAEKALADRQSDADGQALSAVRSGQERRSVVERRSGFDRRKLGGNIAGLHMDKGIARFGGDQAAFLEVLRAFAEHTPPLLEEAARVDQNTLAAYAIALHGIKASSQGIYAGMVSARAHDLERAAIAGDFDFVRANNPGFFNVAWKLVADIENMLGNIATENPKSTKDKPDDVVLSKLLAACRDYDMDGVDAAMAELEEHTYEFDGGLAAWLKNNVESMNFAQVRERLSALLAWNGREHGRRPS
ncbi:MAG: response regulator [Deltaproteobacteria bacterium]|jgi:CheY-like chemotaxis protein|nr:response regulator [Deltaproteobacteria bacterium]